jgi:hypothetical protein
MKSKAFIGLADKTSMAMSNAGCAILMAALHLRYFGKVLHRLDIPSLLPKAGLSASQGAWDRS